jgi:signal transduction histidine kinase
MNKSLLAGKNILKRYCWLLMLFFSPCAGFAQTSLVNQLQLKLKKPMADTARLTLLIQLGAAYQSVSPAKKFYYANVAKALAVKLHNGPAIADAYIGMGISYGVRSMMDSAMYYFGLGYDQAVKSKYILGEGKSLSDIGFAYDRLDNKQEAIKTYFQALVFLKQANFQRGINQCYINIGSLYFDLQEYNFAESYFKQCLKSYTAAKDTAGIGYALFTMGNCYQALGQDKQAMLAFNKSLAIRTKLGDINGMGLARKGLGKVYTDLKQYNKALNNLDSAFKNISSLQDRYEESAILLDKADVYLIIHNYDKAKDCAIQALHNGRLIRSKIDISESLDKLIAVYRGENNMAKAFKYQTDYINVLDSIQIEKTIKDVTLTEFSRIRTENATLAKDNQVISTKNTNYASRLNTYIIVIVAISLILGSVILLLFFIYRRNLERKATNKLLMQQKEEIASINRELGSLNEELNTQMELTSSQNTELEKLNNVKNRFFSIISHDLRGPLSSLQTLFNFYHHGDIGKKELDTMLAKLEDTVLSTGTFLDNLLEWSKSQLDGIIVKPVNFNINETITENIRLFETQAGLKNLKVANEAGAGAAIYADKDMINLVVRNLLSNSIKFCNPGNKIIFTTQIKQGHVVIAISDNGPGISEADRDKLFNLDHTVSAGTNNEKGNRLGLILCRDMVIQNNGNIWYESMQGKGTTFWISLPAAQ